MILRYTVEDDGSVRLVINCGEKIVSAPVSHEHDSLRDLLAGTLAILEGSSQVGVVFMDEPGERHLNIRRLEGGRIDLQVVSHSGWRNWNGGSWNRTGRRQVRLSCESTLWELRDQVLASCEAVLEKLGADVGRLGWGRREFPLELLQRLRAMNLRVRFERGEVTLECCGQRVRVKAASLDELRSKTSALVSGAREARVYFDEEQGEHHLNLRRIDDDRVTLEVVWWSREIEMAFGTTVFLCETSFERFRTQMLAAAGQSAT